MPTILSGLDSADGIGSNFDPGQRAIDAVGFPPVSLDSRRLLQMVGRVRAQVAAGASRHRPFIKLPAPELHTPTLFQRTMRALRTVAAVGLAGDDVSAITDDTKTAAVIPQILADAKALGKAFWWDVPGLGFAKPPFAEWAGELGWRASADPIGYLQMLGEIQSAGNRGGNYASGPSIPSFNKFVTGGGFNFNNDSWLHNTWRYLWGMPVSVNGILLNTKTLTGQTYAPANVGVVYIKGKQAVAAMTAALKADAERLSAPQKALVVEAAKKDAAIKAGDVAAAYTAVKAKEATKAATKDAVRNVTDAEKVVKVLNTIKAPTDAIANVVTALPEAAANAAGGLKKLGAWLPWIIGGAVVVGTGVAVYTLANKAPDLSGK